VQCVIVRALTTYYTRAKTGKKQVLKTRRKELLKKKELIRVARFKVFDFGALPLLPALAFGSI
jgi:hypothetical protein